MKNSFIPYVIAGAVGAVVASLMPYVISSSHADSKLLPFQGRLTDASGAAITDGAKVVEFKMYDAPTGGNVKWAGEVHKLSVNGGLVNTMLGSKAGLGSVDFSTPSFLQITVDANADGQITAADPPLLPRQTVVPAVYAVVAGGLQYSAATGPASVTGSTLLDAGGKIKAGEIAANNAITASQLASDSVESAEIKNEAVTLAKLAPEALFALGGVDSVTSLKIKDGDVQTVDLAGTITGGVESVAGAVTTEKIKDGTIQNRDIADAAIQGVKIASEIAVFQDQRDPGVSSGGASGGTWLTRVLNTDVHGAILPHPSISLVSNRIRLAPGLYRISGSCPAYNSGYHQSRIRNVTDAPGVTVILGTNGFANNNSISGNSVAHNTLTTFDGLVLNAGGTTKDYEVQHFFPVAGDGTNGLGLYNQNGGVAPGEKNLYTTVTIVKIK